MEDEDYLETVLHNLLAELELPTKDTSALKGSLRASSARHRVVQYSRILYFKFTRGWTSFVVPLYRMMFRSQAGKPSTKDYVRYTKLRNQKLGETHSNLHSGEKQTH